MLLCSLSGLLTYADSDKNIWPFIVHQSGDAFARPEQITAAGPLFEIQNGNTRKQAFRPFWSHFSESDRPSEHTHLLYPLFNYYSYPSHYHWHLLNLIRFSKSTENNAYSFELYPFYFSEQTGNPETSYRALWPLAGNIPNFMGREQFQFALWPLYLKTIHKNEIRYSTPWPFIQRLKGPESHGFALWPLYGSFHRDQKYDHSFVLWPFGYHNVSYLPDGQTFDRFGALPFFQQEKAPGLISQTYLWPFFGFTQESDPRPDYQETRYFWPLLVQGRGEEKYINRWMPLFSHEFKPGRSKTWILWPFWKSSETDLDVLTRERSQFLYFLYWDEIQKNAHQPRIARKTFVWPLLSYWNNPSRDRTQIQFLDPLTVFFPRNEKATFTWNPFFALYRYDRRETSIRHSALWNLFQWEHSPEQIEQLTLGPLFNYSAKTNNSNWTFLTGLIGRTTEQGQSHWTFFWND